jgi:eukaryotic-like serine/threonine-protein kinase
MRRPHCPPGLPAAGTHPRLRRCGEGRLNGATQTLVCSGPSSGQRDASAEPCLQPGDVLLERFKVHRLLARGGMGEVYDVFDAALGATVALKKMRTQVLAPAPALHQFRREVLLARRVTHPNVCRLFEFFSSQDDGQGPLVFLTMELLDGATLSEHLAREGKLGDEALPLVRQMVAALSAAHREGVVHRDFKSSNVMLVRASDGAVRVVVTDFGLACGVRPGEAGDSLLPAGMVGSPLYMAPEQVTGDAVSPATDVYALGVVLYEMVTATLPFVGDNVMESAYERLKRPPEPPSVRRPGLSRRWNSAILRCLEVDPAARFSRVEDVLLALGEGPVVLPARRRRLVRRVVVAAGLAAALAVGGSAGVHLLASPASGPGASPAVR